MQIESNGQLSFLKLLNVMMKLTSGLLIVHNVIHAKQLK
jgi:hypothetical protein